MDLFVLLLFWFLRIYQLRVSQHFLAGIPKENTCTKFERKTIHSVELEPPELEILIVLDKRLGSGKQLVFLKNQYRIFHFKNKK